MKRWNGWGDGNIEFPIPDLAKDYLTAHLGEFQDLADAELTGILDSLPVSKLVEADFITKDAMERLTHSCGQSLPDWINLRSGKIPRFTDGVVYPQSEEDIETVIDFAKQNRVIVIPYGGGTSVVGHINPPITERPVLTLNLSKINQLVDLDKASQLATFQAGIRGPEVESTLNKMGFTLGHFPQSFEYSTLGGWVASQSCGQQSYYYGRIEDLFRGGQLISPVGKITLPPFPASAAGPDLRHALLGSEGRFGVLSRATVKVSPLPAIEGFFGVFFKHWEDGVAAVRGIAQKRIQVSMLRLSDAVETETTLILSGNENLIRLASFGLGTMGYREQRCLLIFGVTGDKRTTDLARKSAIKICRQYGGLYTGGYIGKSWERSRFISPYLRNSLWDAGYALDTLETAVTWEDVSRTKQGIIDAITQTGRQRELPILVFGHLSHIYQTGASIYITYLIRRSRFPQDNLEHWKAIKGAASLAILEHGGTISHQHGVGSDHADYLSNEKGTLGMNFLREASRYFDPDGIMNPAVLLNAAHPAHNKSGS